MPRSTLKFRMNTKLQVRLKKEARRSGLTPEHLAAMAIQCYVDSKQAERELENPDFQMETK